MGPRPAGTTLDRRDNDGPYSPDNCRWATRSTQNYNQNRGGTFEYDSRSLTLSEWADHFNTTVENLAAAMSCGVPFVVVAHWAALKAGHLS